MDAEEQIVEQRQQAIDDVLEFLRDPGRQPKVGRDLAPALLNHTWQALDDDYRIADAVRHMLEQALVGKRKAAGIEDEKALSTKARLQRDRQTNNEQLEQFSLAWAYYVEQLPKAELTQLYSVTPRRVEQKLKASRAAVTALLTQQIVIANEVVPASATPGREQSTTATSSEAKRSPTASSQPGVWDDALTKRVYIAVFLLAVCIALWLWALIPHASLTVMLFISSWRVFQHGRTTWTTRGYRTHPQEAGRFWWWISYTAMWCGLMGWFVFIAVTLYRLGPSPPLFAQRWWPFAWFVLGTLVLLAFGTLDLVWWVHHMSVPRWPFHRAKPFATHVWTQRWVMVFVGWMLLLVLVVAVMAMSLGVDLETMLR